MYRPTIGLASHLTYEQRRELECELDVLFVDLDDSLDEAWENLRQLRATVEVVLYGKTDCLR